MVMETDFLGQTLQNKTQQILHVHVRSDFPLQSWIIHLLLCSTQAAQLGQCLVSRVSDHYDWGGEAVSPSCATQIHSEMWKKCTWKLRHLCLNSATFMREKPCITFTSHNVFQTLKGTYDLSINGIILIIVQKIGKWLQAQIYSWQRCW